MPGNLLKNFTIEVEQKLYEKETPNGIIAVYQTAPFGKMLSLNGQILIAEADGFYYYEMMAHPVLFTHGRPHKVLIIGNCFGILQEVLKHASVQEVICITEHNQLDEAITRFFSHLYQSKQDERVKYVCADSATWLSQCHPDEFDIIIRNQQSDPGITEHYKTHFHALQSDGILVEPCQSSLLHLQKLKVIYQNIKGAGFNAWQTLNFPQPSYPSGLRTVMMATKRPAFKRVREKDIYNRPFTTRFYNFDIHKAALVLPEFVREELEIVS